MNDKDLKELIVAFSIFILLISVTAEIGGVLGLIIWALGTIIILMFGYYEYRQDKALERERKKIKMFAEKIKQAYNDRDTISFLDKYNEYYKEYTGDGKE